jgi:uncharacterized protein YecE (DUF72 family)
VGTSGYAYAGWTEAGFYPPGTSTAQMLPLYAQNFSMTELTQTWHQQPRAEDLEYRRRQAPVGFLFSAKANRGLTHEIDPDHWLEHARAFRNGLAPLVQAGQLAAVVVQWPENFDRSVANRRYLAALLGALEGLPLAVEFRQGSWNHDKVFVDLARRSVTLVSVDEPELPGLFPPLAVVTNPDLFYVRFHGRNQTGWKLANPRQMFDYCYSDEELRIWVERRILPMAQRARQGIIVFNNHVGAQAARNASDLKGILKEYGLGLAKG